VRAGFLANLGGSRSRFFLTADVGEAFPKGTQMKELDKVNSKTRVSSPSNKGFLSERVDSRKTSRRRDRVLGELLTENHLSIKHFSNFKKHF
jgi:hypothetical protein